MSAYVVNVDTIDAIVSAARQYPGQTGLSWARLFPGKQPKAGYSHHKFSRYASDDEAPETFNPNTIGRELWTENLRSIHHRYPDTVEVDGGEIPGPLAFSEADVIRYEYGPGSRVVDVDPLGAIGAIRGYRYQACEHPEWHYSIAEAFTGALRDIIIDWMIDRTGANGWTVDQLEDVTGTTSAETTPDGWIVRFRRGQSNAVSITELMTRGR